MYKASNYFLFLLAVFLLQAAILIFNIKKKNKKIKIQPIIILEYSNIAFLSASFS